MNKLPHTILTQQHKPVRNQKKELALHCLMYGASMYNEIAELRDQFTSKD